MDILVWSEDAALARQLASKAREQADAIGWSVSAVQFGEPDDLQSTAVGVDRIYLSSAEIHPETCVDVLAHTIAQVKPQIVLIGGTKLGMEVASRVAERVEAGYAAWTTDFGIEASTGVVTARCMLYTGMGVATYRFRPGLTILSAAPGTFETGKDDSCRRASVVPLSIPIKAPRVGVIGDEPKVKGARLEEAKVVVDVGQGVNRREDLGLARALADVLDGQVACSRPIASDRDWFPEWLGLSGMKIKPELCVTIGISGAIQHIVGIRDSRVIAAVNNDEQAAIFTQADYGVVADLYEFLPVLLDRLKARGIRSA